MKKLNEKKLIIGNIIKVPYFADTKNCKKNVYKAKRKKTILEFCIIRSSRERYYISYIIHSCYKHH